MSELDSEIQKVKERILKYRAKGINEQDTKAALIQPILRALGWDVEDLEDVQREYKRRRQDKPVDYALLLLRSPCLFVEAKALGHNLDDRKWANQIMGYAGVAGVGWVALTDGDEYRLYNTHAAVPVEDKLFRRVVITESSDEAAATLCLLSRDRMQGNEIDRLWNAFFVDRQVKSAVEDLFAEDGDASLLRLLGKRLSQLANRDIKASIRRAEVSVSFPVAPTETFAPSTDHSNNAPARPRKRKAGAPRGWAKQKNSDALRRGEWLGAMMRDGVLRQGQELVSEYKGETVTAVLTADAKVRFEGTVYKSLSAAGAAAKDHVGDQGALPTDGWLFWQTANGKGEVVTLKAIRHDYASTL
ncbi:hypothetical protein [Botrimarina sp.]|uniref:restriction system modified-DNA reader domain-containing protein n=1 Tax=Botrimarina sp. TaxID=2795802 RepID=UPI0032EEC36D